MDDVPPPPVSPLPGGGGLAPREVDQSLIMLATRVEELQTGMLRLTAAVRELNRNVELLLARVAAVERATPWTRPPKPPPPKLPPTRGPPR
jgi:hypothetical protein